MGRIKNKNTPKVSIIVPIYNVEKYLRQCLDSIVNQTLKDIEIILVDDGSTDSCPSICDEYASKDKRIIVIHKENKGLGAAYNTGLDIAKGEYIGFVESDDFIELNMYEELYERAVQSGVDVVKCNFYDYDSQNKIDKKRENFEKLALKQGMSFEIDECCALFHMHSSIWAGIYLNVFLKKENIKFVESKGASYQDFPFIALVYLKAKISLTYAHLYHYRQEPSLLSSIKRRDENLFLFIANFSHTYAQIKNDKKFKSIKNSFFYAGFRTMSFFLLNINDKLKKEFFIKIHSSILDFIDDIDISFYTEYEKKIFKSFKKNSFKKALLVIFTRARYDNIFIVYIDFLKLFFLHKLTRKKEYKNTYYFLLDVIKKYKRFK